MFFVTAPDGDGGWDVLFDPGSGVWELIDSFDSFDEAELEAHNRCLLLGFDEEVA